MIDLNITFAALSDETRRAILTRLTQGETSLSELAEPFELTQTAVSKHVNVLRNAGLLTIEKRGRTRHCRLQAENLKHASAWLHDYESFWLKQFDNLGSYLAKKEDS